MDQPLFQKSAEMILAAKDDSVLKKVLPCLGGFHLLMSFLGSIGYVMAGSGLEELWGTVYAPNAVQHMLTGKAFARAIRAHLLTLTELFLMLLDRDTDSQQERRSLAEIFNSVLNGDSSYTRALENSVLKSLEVTFNRQMEILACSGPQGKLMYQYIQMVMLWMLFLRSVRTADWKLYMYSTREMLPYFVATGHHNYARSVLLQLHLMTDLEQRMGVMEFNKFVVEGYFAVYRSDKKFAALSMDLVIEQCLMRLFKVRGGMTQGRGITESTKATWIKAMPACTRMIEAVEEYTGQRSQTSEQHVQLRKSRQSRDRVDRGKMRVWLQEHPPFENLNVLRSLATGAVPKPEVNCYDAHEIGCEALGALIGKDFKSIVFSKKYKVLNMASSSSAVKVGESVLPVNSTTLFHRITCVVEADDLESCFQYELAPVPLALFQPNGSMRKGTKSSLAHALNAYRPCSAVLPENPVFVIDGGHLLQRVVWQRPATYNEIIAQYVRYVVKHYSDTSIVVFDGYPDKPSVKDPEHILRASKGTSPNLVFEEVMQVSTTQAKFLANKHNKARLIPMVMQALEKCGVRCVQAEADADALVATTAIQEAQRKGQNTVVVAEDTDILTLLIHHCDTAPVFQLAGTRDKELNRVFDVRGLRTALKNGANVILLVHSLTGCDSTSALYNRSKKNFLKAVIGNVRLQEAARLFYDPAANHRVIEIAGQQLLLALYGTRCSTLDSARFSAYMKMVGRRHVTSEIDISSLPPTEAAAKQHCFRAYLQVQLWLGNTALRAEDWGWKLQESGTLAPVFTRNPPAPERILKLTSCRCKGDCANRCSCRSAGLRCSAMCENCCGHGCANHMEDVTEEDLADAESRGFELPDDDPDDPGVPHA